MAIYFYRTNEVPYGVFSNFSAHPFTLDGQLWPTSEHYFQAQKFVGFSEHQDEIRLAATPMEAAEKGRERHRPPRADRASAGNRRGLPDGVAAPWNEASTVAFRRKARAGLQNYSLFAKPRPEGTRMARNEPGGG